MFCPGYKWKLFDRGVYHGAGNLNFRFDCQHDRFACERILLAAGGSLYVTGNVDRLLDRLRGRQSLERKGAASLVLVRQHDGRSDIRHDDRGSNISMGPLNASIRRAVTVGGMRPPTGTLGFLGDTVNWKSGGGWWTVRR